ncbi:MAG: hypothetical protein HQK53_00890 [Oligoflexia bacterium]|nr:hypothetical protein [Oligoflexia bacterium]
MNIKTSPKTKAIANEIVSDKIVIDENDEEDNIERAPPLKDQKIMEMTSETTSKMTFDQYLQFLDDYWDLFGPIPPRKKPTLYSRIKI